MREESQQSRARTWNTAPEQGRERFERDGAIQMDNKVDNSCADEPFVSCEELKQVPLCNKANIFTPSGI